MPKGSRVGITPNKNTGPKQVLEPMDARKKASLGNANGAFKTVDNTGRSDQAGCSKDINECEKLATGGEPLAEACPDRSKEACKPGTDHPCNKEDKTQAACNDEPIVVNKHESCLKKDASQMSKLTTSDSSSCLSEGDRHSLHNMITCLNVFDNVVAIFFGILTLMLDRKETEFVPRQ